MPAKSGETEQLLERLRVSDEWNVRLQQQIQHLLGLPQNEVVEMRNRMQDPDIAIPLLQCYDAVIQEKAEQLETLTRENHALQQTIDATAKEQIDLSNAVQMAEELAAQVQGKAGAETQKYIEAVKELQTELVKLRLEVTRALEAESAAKRESTVLREKLTAADVAQEKLREEQIRLQAAFQDTQRRVKALDASYDEQQLGRETHKVQLQILTREKEEKAEELEQLRAKMLKALRQSADNHNAHLKVVEERHKLQLEDTRAANRTQELEIMKLRAQLARAVDVAGRGYLGSWGGSVASGSSSALRTTAELLEEQTRQSQEREMKRLYNEVATLQQQRDEAIRRYELLSNHLQRDQSEAAAAVQRQLQVSERQVAEGRARCQELEEANASAEAQRAQWREEVHRAQQEALQHRTTSEGLSREVQSLKNAAAEAAKKLATAKAEREAHVQEERRRGSELEERVQKVLDEVRDSRDRSAAELEAARTQLEDLRRQLRQAQQDHHGAEQRLHQQEREKLRLDTYVGRLTEGLEAHKKKLREAELQLSAMQQQLSEAQEQQRAYRIAAEDLRLKNGHLVRTRDQLSAIVNARVM